jgi:curli biogenesis system outer membrane secretion channel CsgG
MRPKWIVPVLAYLFILSIASLLFAQGEAEKRLKKRIAVFTFEDKTGTAQRWWTGKPVGEGMADMLVTALVKSGNYLVVERQEIDALLAEQDLGTSGIVTPQTAAKVGKMLGVEVAVVGAVTEFGYKRSDIGGAVKGLGLGVASMSATVAVDVRLVDTSTGEILAADAKRVEKSKKGLRVDTRKLRFKSRTEFDQSLVGKATREAINKVVKLIDKNMARVPWQAKVVRASGDQVYINVGAQGGVQVGDRFVVYRPGEELVDPDTGLSLGTVETRVGTIEVIKNDIGNGKASLCVVRSGEGFQTGDLVRLK